MREQLPTFTVVFGLDNQHLAELDVSRHSLEKYANWLSGITNRKLSTDSPILVCIDRNLDIFLRKTRIMQLAE